jgi:hypothetical protein
MYTASVNFLAPHKRISICFIIPSRLLFTICPFCGIAPEWENVFINKIHLHTSYLIYHGNANVWYSLT